MDEEFDRVFQDVDGACRAVQRARENAELIGGLEAFVASVDARMAARERLRDFIIRREAHAVRDFLDDAQEAGLVLAREDQNGFLQQVGFSGSLSKYLGKKK